MRRSLNNIARLVLASTVVLASCVGPVSPNRAEPALRTAVVADESWVRVIRPGFGGSTGFSFSLPPGFENANLSPIDSDAALHRRQEANLHYDFGAYTSAPHAEGTDTVKQRIRIGGRTAVVVSYRRPDGGSVVKAWWKEVSHGAIGPNHLLMMAEFTSETDRSELLAAIYSVRFE